MIGWLRRPRDPRHKLGVWGERRAARYLRRSGFRILEANWQGRQGEIDLIAERNGDVRFVEVKTRQSDTHGEPEEAVDEKKQSRLRRAAKEYLDGFAHPPESTGFDIVAVVLGAGGRLKEIRRDENAF